jgi:uncharacterized protein YqhQ
MEVTPKLAEQPRFNYGGQAVIEGVMIRGREHLSLAVRRQDGSISHHSEPLNSLYTGVVRRVPLLRGVVLLMETLMLGLKALNKSASMAASDIQDADEKEISGWYMAGAMALALTLGVGVFFLGPLFIVSWLDPMIASDQASNGVEGGIRLIFLVAYIGIIGRMGDIKRVFAYHGAEHMAVHAYEAGLPLVLDNVRKFGTPHPRCGTAFLLTVLLVSIVVFAIFPRPPLELRILSRIALIPVVAGISYEIIRYAGAHQNGLIGKAVAAPGLLLQRLTTREPDDQQIEVAIHAVEGAIAADAGRQYPGPESPDLQRLAGVELVVNRIDASGLPQGREGGGSNGI